MLTPLSNASPPRLARLGEGIQHPGQQDPLRHRRTIANFKTWRMTHTDYRRPLEPRDPTLPARRRIHRRSVARRFVLVTRRLDRLKVATVAVRGSCQSRAAGASEYKIDCSIHPCGFSGVWRTGSREHRRRPPSQGCDVGSAARLIPNRWGQVTGLKVTLPSI